MPSDRGLAALGLIMQLGGSIFLGCMALVAVVIGFGSGSFAAILVGSAGAVRSAFHRAAGSALVYGSPRGLLRPTWTYIGVALAQTALTLVVFNKSGVPAGVTLTLALLLLAWPLTLLVVLTRPRLRVLAADDVLPPSEDMGFEGAAALMVLFGMMGSLVALFMLYAAFAGPGGSLASAHALLLIGVFAMLLARSVLHTMAGVRGTRGIDSDGATLAAARYFGFGVVSSVITGGALLILFMMGGGPVVGLHPLMLLGMATVVYLLLSWPMILRRFYTERNFSALLAGAEGPSYVRAPDAGMTAIGWLLLAASALQLGLALPGLISGPDFLPSLASLDGLGGPGLADIPFRPRSPWWSIGTGAVQLWAALELIHMTDRHRMAATIYGGLSSVVATYVMWPELRQLERMAFGSMDGFATVAAYFQIALCLVLPVGTMILANRKLLPTAQARMSGPRPDGSGPAIL